MTIEDLYTQLEKRYCARICGAKGDLNAAFDAFVAIGNKMCSRYIPSESVKKLIDWYYMGGVYSMDYQKGILIKGATGRGKTMLFDVFANFMKVEQCSGYQSDEYIPLSMTKVNSRTIAEDFIRDGFEGIRKYYFGRGLMIDDIGAEVTAQYYGNKVDVIAEVIDRREENRLLTFATTNLAKLSERYDDRTTSRMASLFNIWYMDGEEDFRKINLKK